MPAITLPGSQALGKGASGHCLSIPFMLDIEGDEVYDMQHGGTRAQPGSGDGEATATLPEECMREAEQISGNIMSHPGHTECQVLGDNPSRELQWVVEYKGLECGGRGRSPTWR